MSRPVASIEIQAKSTGLAAQLREARAKVGNFADSVGRTMYKGFGLAGKLFGKKGALGEKSMLGGAATHAVGNLMSGAVSKASDFITGIAEDTFDYTDRLKRLQIQADATPASIDELSKSIRKASDETGLGKGKILAGSEAFVTLTGRMDVAKDSAAEFAKIAQATNSETSDIATTAAAAFQNLGIQAGEFERMFSGMAAQGKMGAIELKDLATELSTIAPQWAQFGGGKGLRGARELGAALQVVKRGFGGDAAETVTGLNNFLTAVTKKSARFRDAGVGSFFNVKGKKKELKSVFEIVDQIAKSKLANDPEALTKAFGSSEAYRAFIQLRDGRKDLEAFNRAGMDGGLIQRDFATYMESTGAKLKRSLEVLKNKVADTFTPERIERFAEMIERAADKVGKLAGFLGKIADLAGDVEHVGENIRKFFGGDGHKEKTLRDMMLAGGDGYDMTPGANNSAEAKAMRHAGAVSRLKDVDTWNATVDKVMSKERDEKSTPESILAAKEAYYNAERLPNGQVAYKGAGEAAQIYLRNAKANLTLGDDTTSALGGIGGAVSSVFSAGNQDIAKQILSELKKLNAKSGDTEVKVGGDTVVKATKQAPTHRAAVAK